MTTYSNSKVGKKTKSKYNQNHVQEVVNNLTEAKQIANDYAADKQYVHRATVTTIGNANVRPYHPVYLDGLPNGLSGYWTVLSVEHVFGGIPARYMLKLEVGTNVVGDINPNASKAVATRDVQAELAGQDPNAVSDPILVDVQLSPNSSDLSPNYGTTNSTSATTTSEVAIPEAMSANMYAINPPNFSEMSDSTSWAASQGRTVTNV